jgi:hypothetical protein
VTIVERDVDHGVIERRPLPAQLAQERGAEQWAPMRQSLPNEARPFDMPTLERKMGSPRPGRTALRLGIQRRQLHRLRLSGLTVDQADELAVRAGFHPALVWGSAWWEAANDE